jgi:hypothetical protein
MATQQYVLEAWLGDDHGLDDDQLAELLTISNEIDERYPDKDDQPERDAALSAAYRLMTEGPDSVIAELAASRVAARTAEVVALAGLRQAAHQLISAGDRTEAGFAREGGVDRMAIRSWLGK